MPNQVEELDRKRIGEIYTFISYFMPIQKSVTRS